MLYLITFDHDVYTTPTSVGDLHVMEQDGDSLDQLRLTPVELPFDADDVLQPALRHGFPHPDGLLVDDGLVDIMTAPARLEKAASAQEDLSDQLAELERGPVRVEDAGHFQQKDKDAREARLDYEEALGWATTVRQDLLKEPTEDSLELHWKSHGRPHRRRDAV